MKLYSQEELDEQCAEFRPIPFKLQAAMFGNYNETGMTPRPPSSFHNMTTANTSEALKKRYFDLRHNPERIEPEKRKGHFIAQRINAIDMMNRRRWISSGRAPDEYDIMAQSGEQLEAMFRSELSDLPFVILSTIPDYERSMGELEQLPSARTRNAIEFQQRLRDRLIDSMVDIARKVSLRNSAGIIQGERFAMGAADEETTAFRNEERLLEEAKQIFDTRYIEVRNELERTTEIFEAELRQETDIVAQDYELKFGEREAKLRYEKPEADPLRQASAIRRPDQGLGKQMLEEQGRLREDAEREAVSRRFGLRAGRAQPKEQPAQEGGGEYFQELFE